MLTKTQQRTLLFAFTLCLVSLLIWVPQIDSESPPIR